MRRDCGHGRELFPGPATFLGPHLSSSGLASAGMGLSWYLRVGAGIPLPGWPRGACHVSRDAMRSNGDMHSDTENSVTENTASSFPKQRVV